MFCLQDDEEEGEDELGRSGEVQTGRDVDAGEDEREEGLHPQEIDAYWLQRRIARAFTNIDADASQKLAEEVLSTLQVHLFSLHILRFETLAQIESNLQPTAMMSWLLRCSCR